MANLLGALIANESGGRNIPNVHEGTSSGQAQGYFQITTGTWKDFGGLQFAPTPMQATPQQQAAIAAKIPLKRWDESTVAKMRATGRPIDPNRTLGENLAMNGETFDNFARDSGQPVSGGGSQTDPNWRPRRPGQGVTGGETGPMSPPADPNWRPARPGQQQSGTPLSPLTPPQIDPMQTQIAGGQGDPGYFPPAPEKKEGWRDKLAKMAAGYKAPAVALNDTTLAGMAMPKAARIDQGEVPMFDPNALANQRNQLAMAMQKLNTGKVWL